VLEIDVWSLVKDVLEREFNVSFIPFRPFRQTGSDHEAAA